MFKLSNASLVPSSSRPISLPSHPRYFSSTCKRKTHYQTLGVPETASKSQIKVRAWQATNMSSIDLIVESQSSPIFTRSKYFGISINVLLIHVVRSWASCIIQMFLKNHRPRFYLQKLAKLILYSVTIETGELSRIHRCYWSLISSLDVPMIVAFSTARLWCHKSLPPVRRRLKVLAPTTLGNHVRGHLHENRPPITPMVSKQNLITALSGALIRGRANIIPDLSTMMSWLAHG